MDLVLRNTRVVDGTGGPAYTADVGVQDGRIVTVHRDTDPGPRPTGGHVLDVTGLVTAPGFIDMHAHSDLAVLTDAAHESKVLQGVTLEVLGQDGLSYAPVDDPTLALLRAQITGWNGDPPGFDWNWRGVGAYLDRLDRGPHGDGMAVNAAYLVPQGTVRMLAVGWDNREATAAELQRMRELVATGLEEGAVGLSSGLTYTPGMYAPTSELTELCRVVARYAGYYCPHHRGYGVGALDAYAEMLNVTRHAGCALHLAHATMNFGVNAGRAPELLELIDSARAEGADVSLDTYPYLPGCTTLASMLPSDASEGGPDATLARLRDPAAKETIRHVMEEVGSDGWHGVRAEWDTLEISGVTTDALTDRVGLTVQQIADRDGVPPFEAMVDILLTDRLGTTILQHIGDEDNVQAIMKHPAHTGGSDGLLAPSKPHPRAYGTFPEYLGRYVRELGVLGLEECVAHLTGNAARRLRLPDRGLVREGYRADLVLFDPDTVASGATYDQPRQGPRGIPYVLVDGCFTVRDGERTAHTPGRAVRRTPTA